VKIQVYNSRKKERDIYSGRQERLYPCDLKTTTIPNQNPESVAATTKHPSRHSEKNFQAETFTSECKQKLAQIQPMDPLVEKESGIYIRSPKRLSCQNY
jgi:hypothetical protein